MHRYNLIYRSQKVDFIHRAKRRLHEENTNRTIKTTTTTSTHTHVCTCTYAYRISVTDLEEVDFIHRAEGRLHEKGARSALPVCGVCLVNQLQQIEAERRTQAARVPEKT